MSRLIYIANVRMPSEKAHSYQIAQMCEAFAQVGQNVTLVVPYRVNDQPELRGLREVWTYYDLERNFKLHRLPCLDLIWLLDNRFAFLLQTFSFMIALLFWLPFQRPDKLFSRDPLIVAVLSLLGGRHKLIYEVHHKFRSARGLRFQAWLLRRVGRVVALTGALAAQLENMGARDVIVAHDGLRLERFRDTSAIAANDLGLNIPQGAFVTCYAGRLHTMEMGKGLDVFVSAAALCPESIIFLLVGGPSEGVEALRAQWLKLGLAAEHFIAVGTVPPTRIPQYLALSDVCLITSPHNEFFAHETSPMKLFEYMGAGRAIIATDLPSTREVVQHGVSAYLVPPSDPAALAQALQTLRADPALRAKLGKNARESVKSYTWQARAQLILNPKGA